jgi:hypothetical protein
MWPTWRETYQQTLLDLVSSWEGYGLENAHSGFVDDGIIKIAYTRCSEATEDSSRWSYETGQSELLDRKVESLMNDDIAQFVINSRNSGAIFSKRFASKISGQIFVDAIKKDPSLWRNLYFAERQDVLVEIIKDGFWYTPEIEFTPGDWSKPQTNEEAIERALCCKDTTGARYFLMSYLMAQPIRDLIPLLRPRSRKALMDELYTADQLRPLIREFPHLKGGILEADLGM